VARREFRYSSASVNPTDAFPARRTTLRPYLALNLLNGSRLFSCYGLIDSGADDCIFPASFARQLGFELLSGRRYPFGGVGSQGQEAYFFEIEMEIVNIGRRMVSVGFTTSLDQRGHGLLGQNGFFDRFSVRFDHKKGTFTVYS
jgi:hypothetical protein